MAHTYKSSDPVEANFVENFFNEKGLVCRLLPTGGAYGMQTYDVYIEGDVSEEMLNELRRRIDGPETLASTETEKAEVASTRFSIFEILVIFLVAELIFNSSYMTLGHDLGGLFSSFGKYFLSCLLSLGFIYICCRRKVGDTLNSFFGLAPVSARVFFCWALVAFAYEMTIHFLFGHFPTYFPKQDYSNAFWAITPLLVPLFDEFLFRGFMFRSLELALSTGSALVVSSVLSGLVHYHLSMPYQIVLMGSGLLYGLARINSRSIYVPVGMHFIVNLLIVANHFL